MSIERAKMDIDPTGDDDDFMLEDKDFAYDDSEARRHLAAGRPIFYLEPNTPKGLVIRKSPDGSRDYVELDGSSGYRVVRPV